MKWCGGITRCWIDLHVIVSMTVHVGPWTLHQTRRLRTWHHERRRSLSTSYLLTLLVGLLLQYPNPCHVPAYPAGQTHRIGNTPKLDKSLNNRHGLSCIEEQTWHVLSKQEHVLHSMLELQRLKTLLSCYSELRAAIQHGKQDETYRKSKAHGELAAETFRGSSTTPIKHVLHGYAVCSDTFKHVLHAYAVFTTWNGYAVFTSWNGYAVGICSMYWPEMDMQ